jgi:hypothetical protein
MKLLFKFSLFVFFILGTEALTQNTVTVNRDYTVGNRDEVVFVDVATAGSRVHITLPRSTGSPGRTITICDSKYRAWLLYFDILPATGEQIMKNGIDVPFTVTLEGYSVTLVSDGFGNWIANSITYIL